MTASSTASHIPQVGADQHLDWRQAAAGLLDWWAEAGADVLVDDAPRDWLAPPAPLPAAPPMVVIGDDLPADWAAYALWRSSEAAPEHRWPGAWIAASGPAQAALMVLTDCPDRDDLEGGSLLAGEAGRLFDRMLAAIGQTRETVHVASLCAKRPTAGRVPAADEARLAAIVRHHAALVGARAVLLLGNAASRALLATDLVTARGRLHPLNHSQPDRNAETRIVASFHPRFLLERPVAKAGAWADLQVLKQVLGK